VPNAVPQLETSMQAPLFTFTTLSRGTLTFSHLIRNGCTKQ